MRDKILDSTNITSFDSVLELSKVKAIAIEKTDILERHITL
jgi:hypothetical protein